jgi:hypothetical protein
VFFSLLPDSSHKVLSVLVNNLRVHVKPMYQLYSILKDRDEPPTPDEINIASAKRQLDWKAEAEYLQKLEKSSENIKKAFQNQQAHAIVSGLPPGISSLYDLTTGAMGPGEVRASTYGVGHRMRPAVRRSGKARIHRNDELCASHWHFIEDSETQWYQAAPDEGGRRYN